jgi:hypothetical protein
MADEAPHNNYHTEKSSAQARITPIGQKYNDGLHFNDTTFSRGLHSNVEPSVGLHRAVSYGNPDSSIDSPGKDDEDQGHTERISVHEQRTLLITNLSERTTHKDLAGVIRGGRLLDIFVRNDRTAAVSFVEGAADFFTYAKRNDIYMHMKRVSVRLG